MRAAGGLFVVGTRFQRVKHRDRRSRHDQIDDEYRLGHRPVDAAEGIAVESKATRQRDRRQMPLMRARPAYSVFKVFYRSHGAKS